MTYANIMATIAVVIAIGSGATPAAHAISSAGTALKKKVLSIDIADGTIRVRDLHPETRKALKGNKGATGDTGNTGARGENGEAGANGLAGPQGARGETGIMGLQGMFGLTGFTGVTGADGPIGPQGGPGVNGMTGLQGMRGNDGAAGANGNDGAAGANGNDGAAGANGNDGAPGNRGLQGPAGANGNDGAPGNRGLQGPAGTNGVDGNPGANGNAGAQGPAGITSAHYEVGESATVREGDDYRTIVEYTVPDEGDYIINFGSEGYLNSGSTLAANCYIAVDNRLKDATLQVGAEIQNADYGNRFSLTDMGVIPGIAAQSIVQMQCASSRGEAVFLDPYLILTRVTTGTTHRADSRQPKLKS